MTRRLTAAAVAIGLLGIGAPLILAVAFGLFAARPPTINPKPRYRGFLDSE